MERIPKDQPCQRYVEDTWRSLSLSIDPNTGLIADRIAQNSDGTLQVKHYTSPTNIGLSLACLVVADDLGLETTRKVDTTIHTILKTLSNLDRVNGLYYNWYDPRNGRILTKLPDGGVAPPLISAIENTWLIAGLAVTRQARPNFAPRVNNLLNQMNINFFYDKDRKLFHGAYYPLRQKFSEYHNDILGSETRMESYIGIGLYDTPIEHFKELGVYKPGNAKPNVTYQERHDVFKSWGGSTFEQFMPTVFLPEQIWSSAWLKSLQVYATEQIEFGHKTTGNGVWGFSPCQPPRGRYREFGVPTLAMNPEGYTSEPIVTPHAIALTLPVTPSASIQTLQTLEAEYPHIYHSGLGFSDSVDTRTGEVSQEYLALDQSMLFLSLYNYLTNNRLHAYYGSQVEKRIRPIIENLSL